MAEQRKSSLPDRGGHEDVRGTAPALQENAEVIVGVKEGETVAALRFSVVALGASAGGLEAFRLVLQNLPADTGMAFVLIQHLAPQHASQLRLLLAPATSMPVAEVIHGVTVKPNHVYVIPPNKLMSISGGC